MQDFFEQQDRARKQTRVLVLLMALAVLGMGGAIYGVLWLGVRAQLGGLDVATHQPVTETLLSGDMLVACVLGTAAIVAIASLGRMLMLRGGGSQVAEMLGGRLVSGQPKDVNEKRLLNVVEEMAIASGMPVPQVFVLDGEPGINAFAAGHTPSDAAIGITQGGLEALDREQLQGVIAHEMSHVLNGDMRLNLRLLGIVFGIVCIGLLGRIAMRAGSSRSGISRRSKGAGGLALIGLAIFLIGSIGELFGKLIKAAVSRQREFLADASAVQLTRNPQGIGGALRKIGELASGSHMQNQRAEEASHMFFGDIHQGLFARAAFATHPPLEQRIARILGETSERAQQDHAGPRASASRASASRASAARASAAPEGLSSFAGASQRSWSEHPSEVAAHVGTLDASGLARAQRLIGRLPESLISGAHVPFSASAIVCALVLAEDPAISAAQRDVLRSRASPAFDAEVARFGQLVPSLTRSERHALIELLSPALAELSPSQRQGFLRLLEQLVHADQRLSIFEHVLLALLRDRLSPEIEPHARASIRHHSLKAVRTELALALSLLAHAGSTEAQAHERAFAAGAARVPELSLGVLPANERMLLGIDQALVALRALTPKLRAVVIDAAAHTALADQRMLDDEASLLSLFCAALECPLPPWSEGG